MIHAEQHTITNSSLKSRTGTRQRSTPWRRACQWLFTRRRENGNTGPYNSSNRKVSPSGKWYQDIHNCPLYNFRIALCDENLQALVIEGQVSEDDLKSSWDNMYVAFLDGISGEADMATAAIMRKVDLLQFRISKAISITRYLGYYFDQKMIDLLIKIGAADAVFPQEVKAQEVWWRRLNGRINRWIQEKEQEEKKLLDLVGTRAEGKTTHESFQSYIVQVERYMKFGINDRETTVGRFMAMVADYQRYIAQSQKKLEDARRGSYK